jgi:hypothetical protein
MWLHSESAQSCMTEWKNHARAPRDLVGRLVIEADSGMLLTFDWLGGLKSCAIFLNPKRQLGHTYHLGPILIL